MFRTALLGAALLCCSSQVLQSNPMLLAYDFLVQSDERMHLGSRRSATLIIGPIHSGKSTLTAYLTGRQLRAKYRDGDYLIEDRQQKVGHSDDPHTMFPDLSLMNHSGVMYALYDCPGYSDGSNESLDIVANIQMNNLLSHLQYLNLVLTISYRDIIDVNALIMFAERSVDLINRVKYHQKSIGLVVTKADNFMINGNLESDILLQERIVYYLKKAEIELCGRKDQLRDWNALFNKKMIRFIRIFIQERKTINVMRKPLKAGTLENQMSLPNRNLNDLKNLPLNLKFQPVHVKNFKLKLAVRTNKNLDYIIVKIKTEIQKSFLALIKYSRNYYASLLKKSVDYSLTYRQFTTAFNILSEKYKNMLTESSSDTEYFIYTTLQKIKELNINFPTRLFYSIEQNYKYFKLILAFSYKKSTLAVKEWIQKFEEVIEYLKFTIEFMKLSLKQYKTSTAQILKQSVHTVASKNSIASCCGLYKIDKNYEADRENQILRFLESVVKQQRTPLSADMMNNLQNGQGPEHNQLLQKLLNRTESDTKLPITECINTKFGKKLLIRGFFIRMSTIHNINCENINRIEMFALNTIYLDQNLEETFWKKNLHDGPIEVAIMAPNLEVSGDRNILFNLNGKNAVEDSVNSFNGEPGQPGGPAGSFFIIAGSIKNGERLKITMVGGKGSQGMNGQPGKDGDNGFDISGDRSCYFGGGDGGIGHMHALLPKHIVHLGRTYSGLNAMPEFCIGKRGINGSDGGNAGSGGYGGNSNKGIFYTLNSKESRVQIVSRNGQRGKHGIPGKGGIGGYDEYDYMSNRATHNKWSENRCLEPECKNPDGNDGIINNANFGQPSKPFKNAGKVLNDFKFYSREMLNNSFNNQRLIEFYRDLETSNNISQIYTTMDLTTDTISIELQYYRLKNTVNFLPFYLWILNNTEKFMQQKNGPENNDEMSMLIRIYTAVISKINMLKLGKRTITVCNILEYFKNLQGYIQQFCGAILFESLTNLTNSFKDGIDGDIKSSLEVLNSDVKPEIDAAFKELNSATKDFEKEISEKIKEEEKKLKEMKKTSIWRTIIGVCKIIVSCIPPIGFGAVISAVGTAALGMADAAVGDMPNASASINSNVAAFDDLQTATHNFDKANNIINPNKTKSALHEAIDKISSMRDIIKNTVELLEALPEKIKEADKIIPEIKGVLNHVKNNSVVLKIQEKYLEWITKSVDKVKSFVEKKNLKIPAFLKFSKEGMHVVISTGLEVTGAVSQYLSDKSEIGKQKEKITQLVKFKQQVSSKMGPLIHNMQSAVNAFGNKMSQMSMSKLFVEQSKIQNMLKDMMTKLKAISEGFKVQGTYVDAINKIIGAMEVQFKIIKQTQEYRERKKMVDYQGKLQSKKYSNPFFKNEIWQTKINQLTEILKFNLISEQYIVAVKAMRIYMFPFSDGLKQELFDNMIKGSVDLSNLSRPISAISAHIDAMMTIVNDNTITSRDQKIFRANFSFISDRSMKGCFGALYTWDNATFIKPLTRLLSGEEVYFKANPARNKYNSDIQAIKLSRFYVQFEILVNAEKQIRRAGLGNISHALKLFNKFHINMTHMGDSEYVCDANVYKIKTAKYNFLYSEVNGKFVYLSKADKKMTNILSPFATYKIKLVPHKFRKKYLLRLRKLIGLVSLHLAGEGEFVFKPDCPDNTKNFDPEDYYPQSILIQ